MGISNLKAKFMMIIYSVPTSYAFHTWRGTGGNNTAAKS